MKHLSFILLLFLTFNLSAQKGGYSLECANCEVLKKQVCVPCNGKSEKKGFTGLLKNGEPFIEAPYTVQMNRKRSNFKTYYELHLTNANGTKTVYADQVSRYNGSSIEDKYLFDSLMVCGKPWLSVAGSGTGEIPDNELIESVEVTNNQLTIIEAGTPWTVDLPTLEWNCDSTAACMSVDVVGGIHILTVGTTEFELPDTSHNEVTINPDGITIDYPNGGGTFTYTDVDTTYSLTQPNDSTVQLINDVSGAIAGEAIFPIPPDCDLVNSCAGDTLFIVNPKCEIDTLVKTESLVWSFSGSNDTLFMEINGEIDTVVIAGGGGAGNTSSLSLVTNPDGTETYTHDDGTGATQDFCVGQRFVDHENQSVGGVCQTYTLNEDLRLNDNGHFEVSSLESKHDNGTLTNWTNHHLNFSLSSTGVTLAQANARTGAINSQTVTVNSGGRVTGVSVRDFENTLGGYLTATGRDVTTSSVLYGTYSGQDITATGNTATSQFGRQTTTQDVDNSTVTGFSYTAQNSSSSDFSGSVHTQLDDVNNSNVTGNLQDIFNTSNVSASGRKDTLINVGSAVTTGNENYWESSGNGFLGGQINVAKNTTTSLVIGQEQDIDVVNQGSNAASIFSTLSADDGTKNMFRDILASALIGKGYDATDIGNSLISSSNGGSINGYNTTIAFLGPLSNLTQHSGGVSARSYVNGNNVNGSLTFSYVHGNDITLNDVSEVFVANGALGASLIINDDNEWTTAYDEYTFFTDAGGVNSIVFDNTGIFVNGTQLTVPDYVFEDDYKLPTIEEQVDFMLSNKHMPAATSAKEWESEGKGVNIIDMTSENREELEKAHLFIGQLNEQLKDQAKQIEELKAIVNELNKNK